MNNETIHTAFVYDWQRDDEGFLKWMLPCLITGINKEVFDQLSDSTNKWTHIELRIQVNGVDVPAENFLSSVKRNMTYYANQEAQRLVSEIPELRRLHDLMEEADMALRQRLAQILTDAGVEIGLE